MPPLAHMRPFPHPWTDHGTPAPRTKSTASADTESRYARTFSRQILYVLVKGMVTIIFSYLKTKLEGNYFISSYLFFFSFFSLPFLSFSLVKTIIFFLLLTLPPTSLFS